MPERPSILLVTTDQQRYDSLSCHGNAVCRTPTMDALAASGVDYRRAHVQNPLCTPSRCTMLTGQHVGTHGVWCNGVALPQDAPSVADVLSASGYATAHIGKMHFEPGQTFTEHLRAIGADRDWTGPHRGFGRVETCGHFPFVGSYARFLRDRLGYDGYVEHREQVMAAFTGFGGDTGAPQALYSPLPPELHATTWVVDRAIAWLDELPPELPFFAWVSFDDPHHPFKPPSEYGRRHDWRDIPLPAARPSGRDAVAADLDAKPWQYGAYWRGEYVQHEGSLGDRPGDLTDDQLRELTALTYGMVELIDDQLRRLLAHVDGRDDVHVLFCSDHGELLGDHGLLFKGPFHLDGLLRVPLIWRRPGGLPGVVTDPVGLVDLAPTMCSIAGVDVPEWMDGEPLPDTDGHRERVVSVFDSSYRSELALRTLYRDGFVVTAYPRMDGVGELYDLRSDPSQFRNLWDDPTRRRLRDGLLADLRAHVIEDARPERYRCWGHA